MYWQKQLCWQSQWREIEVKIWNLIRQEMLISSVWRMKNKTKPLECLLSGSELERRGFLPLFSNCCWKGQEENPNTISWKDYQLLSSLSNNYFTLWWRNLFKHFYFVPGLKMHDVTTSPICCLKFPTLATGTLPSN